MFRNDLLRPDSLLTRRSFLKLGTLVALAGPRLAAAQAPERSLSFHNLHTSERLKAVYWSQGVYLSGPLAEIDHVLRDHRTGTTHEIDRRLLDLLCLIRNDLETTEPFE